MQLTKQAKQQIKDAGLTITEYCQYWMSDSKWYGDKCGCPDDRCISFHHMEDDDCRCLEPCIRTYNVKTRRHQ